MAERRGLGIPVPARRYDAKAVSMMSQSDVPLESYTQQHLKEEADVNTIVKRFGLMGAMPKGTRQGVYGDFTGVDDFAGAMELISRAREEFMALPPDVRERFGNDPARVVELAQTLSEEDFLSALGYEVAKEPTAPVVEPAAEPSA